MRSQSVEREKALGLTLLVKIVLTFFWALGALLARPSLFETLGFPTPELLVFVRLLGMAYAALLVGYILAYRSLRRTGMTEAVWSTVWVGFASNGGAALILITEGVLGAYALWGVAARVIMWLSAVLTASIAVSLWWTGLQQGRPS